MAHAAALPRGSPQALTPVRRPFDEWSDGWQIDREPTFEPKPDEYPEEVWGIEIRASPPQN
jgi:hypothetical protein